MQWVEGLGCQCYPQAAKIKTDVCDTITKAMSSLENIPQNEVNCTMVYLLGHPNQALLDINFYNVLQSVNERELAKQLSELFDNVTEKCKDQRGPVVGKVQLEGKF
ncbi:unnamed protein product [Dicrocoelium dendriticum]|nr:unnamed protein product [Dicrocoelium dendriticum]